jgi:hypothetical protein
MIEDIQLQDQIKMKARTHEQIMCLFQAAVVIACVAYHPFGHLSFLLGAIIMVNLLADQKTRVATNGALWLLNLFILETSEARGYKGITDTKLLLIAAYFAQLANIRLQMELLEEVAGAMWVYGQIHVLQLVHWQS